MPAFEQVQATYQTFSDQFQSLILSTVDAQGKPHASYSPFIRDRAGHFYIYVSGLAAHTQNIAATGQVGLMLIEDEQSAQQVFARQRLTYDCTAHLIERESDQWSHLVDQFGAKFGEMIAMMRQLPDFRIFCLVPQSGRFVLGFGAIYEVDPANIHQLCPPASA